MAGRTISQSVGYKGVNRRQDVRTVQELINANIGRITPLAPLKVDGLVGPATIGAIEEFQRRVVRMNRPDARVDPGGKTLRALNQGALRQSPSSPGTGTFRVVFQHGGKVPDMVKGSAGTAGLYESAVTISGSVTGSFRGSIYPDDMSVKGRIKDGIYDLYLGFHKRQGKIPTDSDLVVRTQGFRAALIINADKPVPVISDNPGKTTSQYLHVHNGFHSKRYSEGCPTIAPGDWSRFIKIFLDRYTNLADWTSLSRYVGKKIGVLEVKT